MRAASSSPCGRRGEIEVCAWPWELRRLWRRCDPQEPDDPQDDPLKWPLDNPLKWPLDNPLKWPLDDHDPEDPRALLSVSRAGAT